MRAGWLVSAIAHVGVAMMTLLTAWETPPVDIPESGMVVPIDVVNIAAESNVRALAPPQQEEAAPADAAAEPPPPQEAEAAPDPNPRERPRQNELDLAALSRELMVDKQRPPRPERVDGAPSERTQRGAGLGTAETARLEDRLRAIARTHITRNNCWRMPIDLPEPDRLVITVSFDLDRNGNLRGEPRVTSPSNYNSDPAMRTAAESALRAVRLCDPFPFADDPTVADHYELWRQMEYTFRPRL
jgi:hypothetical protein